MTVTAFVHNLYLSIPYDLINFMIWYSVVNKSKVHCYKSIASAIIFLMLQKDFRILVYIILLLIVMLD